VTICADALLTKEVEAATEQAAAAQAAGAGAHDHEEEVMQV